MTNQSPTRRRVLSGLGGPLAMPVITAYAQTAEIK